MILNTKLKSMLLASCLLIGADTQAGLISGAVAYWTTKVVCYTVGTAAVVTAAPATIGVAVATVTTAAPAVTAAIGAVETTSLVVGGFFTLCPFLP